VIGLGEKLVKKDYSVRLLGIEINSITTSELLEIIYRQTKIKAKSIIANTNIHAMNIAYHDELFRSFVQGSKINFCDGAGVMLGSRLVNKKIIERITYADFIWQLAAFASMKGLSLYFVGASPGVAEEAGKILIEKFPQLRIVGTHHGYFNKNVGHPENTHVIAQINASSPDILIVGMGMPIQEYWILDNIGRLDVKVVLNGGAVFDYISGTLRRAPRWMTNHGLEWLGRLLIEPSRLWRRYLIGIPVFYWRIFVHHILGFPLPYE
jgi:N-acetylglucosaminyldiphosphoundecaprenol N-acetyl-beta-D-mannosaminyltransferase